MLIEAYYRYILIGFDDLSDACCHSSLLIPSYAEKVSAHDKTVLANTHQQFYVLQNFKTNSRQMMRKLHQLLFFCDSQSHHSKKLKQCSFCWAFQLLILCQDCFCEVLLDLILFIVFPFIDICQSTFDGSHCMPVQELKKITGLFVVVDSLYVNIKPALFLSYWLVEVEPLSHEIYF